MHEMRDPTLDFDPGVWPLFDRYVHGDIDRRTFLREAAKFTTGALTATALLGLLSPNPIDTDDLATTVDYSELAQRVARVAGEGSLDLIETLAERVAQTCLAEELVVAVEVTVHKPQAPLPVPVADVAVSITRRKPA